MTRSNITSFKSQVSQYVTSVWFQVCDTDKSGDSTTMKEKRLSPEESICLRRKFIQGLIRHNTWKDCGQGDHKIAGKDYRLSFVQDQPYSFPLWGLDLFCFFPPPESIHSAYPSKSYSFQKIICTVHIFLEASGQQRSLHCSYSPAPMGPVACIP